MSSFLRTLSRKTNYYQLVKNKPSSKQVAFPETPYGSRVIFAHTYVCNNVNGRHNFEMAFTSAKPVKHSETLRHAIVCVVKSESLVYFGTSACSPLDKFNSKLGKVIALRRALHALNSGAHRYNYYGPFPQTAAEFTLEYGDPVLCRLISSLLNDNQRTQ